MNKYQIDLLNFHRFTNTYRRFEGVLLLQIVEHLCIIFLSQEVYSFGDRQIESFTLLNLFKNLTLPWLFVIFGLDILK